MPNRTIHRDISTPSIVTDVIDEKTSAAGVTIEGVLIKDGAVTPTALGGLVADVIAEKTSGTGVTIDGTLVKDGGVSTADAAAITTNTVSEKTAGSGVTVDSLLVKDGGIGTAGTAVNICADSKYAHASWVYGDAAAIDSAFYIARRAMKVEGIHLRPSVVGSDGGAVTAIVTKAPSGTAPASGTSLHASGSFDLKGAVDTDQAATLHGTPSVLLLAAGDALCLDVSGTTTAARGCVTVTMVPV